MKILVFGGTTEGRRVAEYLNRMNEHSGKEHGMCADVYVSVATEYGWKLLDRYRNIRLLAGRMDEDEITCFLQEKEIELVIDATHPFAVLVTANIRRACERACVQYLRCLREPEDCMDEIKAPACDQKRQEMTGEDDAGQNDPEPGDADVVFVDSVAAAVEYLKCVQGNVLIATGSKELKLYTQIDGYQDRCYARVLSVRDSVERSIELGFEGAHLIAMQGPFSRELNVAMLRQTGAKYFVTKESGKTGGFEEKYQAALETGTVLIVVGRPREDGLRVDEICGRIDELIRKEREG